MSFDNASAVSNNDKIVYVKKKENLLGKGGFAKVYKGVFNGRDVAVKRVKVENIDLIYNDRELVALQNFNHPNIVTFYHCQDDGVEYKLYALELCVATLTKYCEGKYKGLVPSEIDGMIQMASGLEYIHSKQRVHRDIKPDNVLISINDRGEAQLKLSDFGFCKQTDKEGKYSVKNSVGGTECWMAPEQLSLLDVPSADRDIQRPTNTSDIFSLGCVFFYFLVGAHPFGDYSHVFENVRRDNPVNLKEKAVFGLRFYIIQQMIKKTPEDRFKLPLVISLLGELKSSPPTQNVAHATKEMLRTAIVSEEATISETYSAQQWRNPEDLTSSRTHVGKTVVKATEGLEGDPAAFKKKGECFRNKKLPTLTYSNFLIDKPVPSRKNYDGQSKHHLMDCLRYRLSLSLGDTKQQEDAVGASSLSLFDELLRLVDDFDAAGRLEIFRLLLERRSAIPLLIPDSGRHHLHVFRYVSLPGTDINLGEDKSLLRVAVVSCRIRSNSNTSYLLNELFNIDSVHRADYLRECITSNEMTAEIGCGFLESEKQQREGAQSVLVLHVVGNFLPLWPFLLEFVDCVVIEDDPDQQCSFYNIVRTAPEGKRLLDDINAMNNRRGNDDTIPFVLLCKPSYNNKNCVVAPKEQYGFRHLYLECSSVTRMCTSLKPKLIAASKSVEKLRGESQVKCLHELPLLKEEMFETVKCTSPADIQIGIRQAVGNQLLESIKTTKWVLQLCYMEQAQYEEEKNNQRLNDAKVKEANRKITNCIKWRRSNAEAVAKEPLLQLFLQLLEHNETHARVLNVRKLEQILATRSALELDRLLNEIDQMYASYMNSCCSPGVDAEVVRELKKNWILARMEYNRKVLSIEHLWREISHVYTSMPTNLLPKVTQTALPRLGAQHLLDGFGIELLDGDANLIHLDWIVEVLRDVAQLIGKKNKEKIFVLSVIGVQSSGKSTLLNTMFGIQMRTSVGQCTRGINMQLIAVDGRPEYDYVLLLDTEGCRAAEFHGLPGSEKRDNQMATLSILLADATIVVINGENDAAVKDILPIVLLAYEDSKFAESNGGRLSSMMFFVYNRVDTTQKNKLNGIIQVLGSSLHEAFDQVQKTTAASSQSKQNSPFRSFQLDTNANESDVCILGNVKVKYEPPGDVPDSSYGETLKRFREHIHRRVTTDTKKDKKDIWTGRSILEFSEYIKEVWKCIGSADFSLNFANIREHAAFDSLDSDYKQIERRSAEAYFKAYQQVEKEMATKKTVSSVKSDEELRQQFEEMLDNTVKADMDELDDSVKKTVHQKGREKWAPQYENQWEHWKTEQAQDWRRKVNFRFASMFTYEKQLENYKKEMRQKIRNYFTNKGEGSLSINKHKQLDEFNKIYSSFLQRAAKEFPSKDIEQQIAHVYQNSPIIKKCQINISLDENRRAVEVFEQQIADFQTKVRIVEGNKSVFQKAVSLTRGWMNSSTDDEVFKNECIASVYKLIIDAVANKRCYDNSIVEEIIFTTRNLIDSRPVTIRNSLNQTVHLFARVLVTKLLKEIHFKWEKENSPYEKLNSETSKKAMREYFDLVSSGCRTTQLFATVMSNTLEEVLPEAFEKEMIQRTVNVIRNERWLHDARFMHKHIDLYLISLLEDGTSTNVNKVLDHIRQPEGLYDIVLEILVTSHIPKAQDVWQSFVDLLEGCIDTACKLKVNIEKGSHRAQTFVDELRKQFFDCKSIGMASNLLGNAFAFNCTEYDDCDAEEQTEFQKLCKEKLTDALKQMNLNATQKAMTSKLSTKVIEHMKFLNDAAALPRCNVACPRCKSMCIESINHNTKVRKHDAVHQPEGIVGISYRESRKLAAESCCVSYEKDQSFYLYANSDETHRYREFSTHFTDWKDPRINEELPFREFLLATYNNTIAKKYGKEPCDDVPAHFTLRDLDKIREQLEIDTGKK